MRKVLLPVVLSVGLIASPVMAETKVITGIDRKLYLVENKEVIKTSSGGTYQGSGGFSSYEGSVYSYFITKGPIRISNERFVELLKEAKVDCTITKRAGSGDGPQGIFGAAALGTLALLPVGLGMMSVGNSTQNPGLSSSGMAIGYVGVAGFSLSSALWALSLIKAPVGFSLEEAYEAIELYNRTLPSD